MNPNWNHQLNPGANAGSPFYDQYAYDQFDAAQGWNVVHPEVRNFPGFSYNGSMIPSQRHESSSVPREFEVEQVASASESKSSKGKGKAPAKATYEKWTSKEQSFLVDLWAEKHERLESKDARKVWAEIAEELEMNFKGTKKNTEKCQRKIKYLVDKYKDAKVWNRNQSGGHMRKSLFYDKIDCVLCDRDAYVIISSSFSSLYF